MSDVEVATKRKRVAEKPVQWWHGETHPLTDADFVLAFCRHVLLTTDDYSLKVVRERAFKFIRGFMHPEIQRSLADYREEHPSDQV